MKGNILVKAETFPETSGVTIQHSLRTNHGSAWVKLPPDENGFHKLDGKYRAIFTRLRAAQDAVFKPFVCNCKTDCSTGRCTCPKYNLPCTGICGVYQGLTSRNILYWLCIYLYNSKRDYLYCMGYVKVTTWHVFKSMKGFMNFWITITSILYKPVTHD